MRRLPLSVSVYEWVCECFLLAHAFNLSLLVHTERSESSMFIRAWLISLDKSLKIVLPTFRAVN